MEEQRELIEKFKSIGFVFTQPEFCTKDKCYIVLDCFPYLALYNKKSFEFESFEEFQHENEKYIVNTK